MTATPEEKAQLQATRTMFITQERIAKLFGVDVVGTGVSKIVITVTARDIPTIEVTREMLDDTTGQYLPDVQMFKLVPSDADRTEGV